VAPYITATGAYKEIVLDTLTPVSAVSSAFQSALQGGYGNPWVFNYPNASPAGLSLTVKTYTANAHSTMGFALIPPATLPAYGPTGGGLIDVTTNYKPAPGETVHWVQYITTNTPGTQTLNNTESTLDADDPNHNPYYNYGGQDQRGFFDFSQRPLDTTGAITWQAEMHLAVETAPNTVTIYPDGISWGWSVQNDLSDSINLALSVTSDVNPTTVFKPTTITATFAAPPSGSPDPTGQVEFVNDTKKQVLGIAPIKNVAGVLSASVVVGGAVIFAGNGDLTIRATYGGDANYYGNTATYVQTVNKAGARINMGSSANPVALAQPVTWNVTVGAVDPGAPIPTGTVNFDDGNTILGTATLDANGTAYFTTSALTAGSHSITAVYSGDNTFDGSTSDVLAQVVNAPPVITLGSGVTINAGSTFTRSGSFTGSGSSYTATVDYGDGSGPQSLTLNSGGTFTLSHLYGNPGSDSVTVTVTDNSGSEGEATLQLTVQDVPPTAAFSNGGPVVHGNPVTFGFSNQYDPSPAVTAAGFTYSYDVFNNGTFEEANVPNASWSYFFTTAGQYTIHGRIIDEYGNYTDYWTTITVY